MLEKIIDEKGQWICLSLKLNLFVFQVKFKNKINGFYRSLSSGGGGTLMSENNFIWFHKSFTQGFYRASIVGSYVNYVFYLKMDDMSKANMTIRQLLIRTKKLGAFNVSINQIDDLDSINYADQMLLSSKNGMNSYQKILNSYKN